MRDWLLIRLFLRRFLENDLVSPDHDRRAVVSVVCGAIAGFSLFTAALSALVYQFSNEMPAGIYSLQSLDDLFLFTAGSMLLLALVAVMQWEALALEARDTAVLGPLPLAAGAIVRAKFVAVALLAIGVSLLWNLLPALLRPFAIPIGLPVSIGGVARLTVAHAVTTGAAGAFGFLSIVALRETLTAVLGRTRFRSISPALQASLLVAVISGILLLPSQQSRVARQWLTQDTRAAMWYPPLWFVGMHQIAAGDVIDSLPHPAPVRRYLVVPEQSATRWYRSLGPVFRQLSRRALGSLALVGLVTAIAAAWNNRRLPAAAMSVPPRRRLSRPLRALVDIVVPAPLHQAGFWFATQTVFRRSQHRTTLAAWGALGLSLVMVTTRGQMADNHTDLAALPLALLAAQTFLLLSLLAGVRHAARLPAELRSSTTFRLAWSGEARRYLSGVTRAAWLATALPLLLMLAAAHLYLFGARAALLHFGVGVALSALMVEALFFRYRGLPFVSPAPPADDIKARALLGSAGAICGAMSLAALERQALAILPLYLLLLAVLFAASALLTARRWLPASVIDPLTEVPEAGQPTQRLGLSAAN